MDSQRLLALALSAGLLLASCAFSSESSLSRFCGHMDELNEFAIDLYQSHHVTHAISTADAVSELSSWEEQISRDLASFRDEGKTSLQAGAGRVIDALRSIKVAEMRGQGFDAAFDQLHKANDNIPARVCLQV
jgi:hypothetical protein